MKVNISEASKMAGITRATFYRHIEAKGITIEKDTDGNPKVDVSELVRVYGDKLKLAEEGALNSDDTSQIKHLIQHNTPATKQPIQHNTLSYTASELEVLKERIRSLEMANGTLESERVREREQLTEQIESLRESLEKAQGHHKQLTALLTDQRSEDDKRNDAVHQQRLQMDELMIAMQNMMHERSEEQERIVLLEKRVEKMKRAGHVIQTLKEKNKKLAHKNEALEKELKKTWFQKLVG